MYYYENSDKLNPAMFNIIANIFNCQISNRAYVIELRSNWKL